MKQTLARMGLVPGHTKPCPVQVLCAYVFEYTLSYESGTLYALVGSVAIAAGVLTIDSAKTAKAESAPFSIQDTLSLMNVNETSGR